MPAGRIPIENLYYLLCYAWDVLPEADVARVSATSELEIQDLLARVLINSTSRLLKKGLDRAYLACNEELAGVRGRLDLNASVKRLSFSRARAWCVFDELSPDVLHNRMIKTTLRQLASAEGLDPVLADELRELYRRMPGIGELGRGELLQRLVVLARHNATYALALSVCEIVQQNLLVDEASGAMTFRDFTRDDRQMARVFEQFLLRFFQRELKSRNVKPRTFAWQAEGEPDQLAYLPLMRTDIVVSDDEHMMVIDAKYYAETLSEHLTKQSLRSGHLYQMLAYMTHLTSPTTHREVEGILIYPRVTETVGVRVRLCGHPLLATTINLAQPWPGIRQDLLRLVGPDRVPK